MHKRAGLIGLVVGVAALLAADVAVTTAATSPGALSRNHASITIEALYNMNGITVQTVNRPCGHTRWSGCYDELGHVYIESGNSPDYVTFTMWHEFHHWLDQQNGVKYTGHANECAADAYAFARDAAARGNGWGYSYCKTK